MKTPGEIEGTRRLGECGAVKEEEGEMADLRLVSTRNRQLKPLVEAALANELRLMEAGIRRTEQRLQEFERKYRLGTQAFLARYENDEIEETLDFDEWIGEFRLLVRLREKADTLKDIRFAN
jgi:hypothetical protein